MKPLWTAALVLVCLLVVAGCAPAAPPAPPPPTAAPPTPEPDLVAPVKAWAGAINKGDVEAALAPLTDDVTWRGGEFYMKSASRKERVRPLFEYLVGVETMFQVKDCQPQDNRAVCGLSLVNGCIAACGAADGLTGKLEFVYQPDGRVGEISVTLDDPRQKDSERFRIARSAWALENRTEEYAKLNYYSREGGSIDLRLCEEYAETLK